jgi:hypothetical protein
VAFGDIELFDLIALISRRAGDGARVYSDDELRTLVVVLFLAGNAEVDAPPGSALAKALERFAAEAQLQPGQSAEHVQRAIEAWLAAHPLPPALVDDIKQFLVDLRTPDAQRVAAMFGDKGSLMPVGQQPAPEGAAKASPLARFTLDVPKRK